MFDDDENPDKSANLREQQPSPHAMSGFCEHDLWHGRRWAVEGAVGSEYKIDATYLSPHLNMASRTVSACKQYGVSILLSQAVQELMSSTARSKLLHLNTVSVKGSSHVTENFEEAFYKGRDAYLSGNWSEAIKYLEGANEIMVENVMEQRFAEEDLDDQDLLHGWREAGQRRAAK